MTLQLHCERMLRNTSIKATGEVRLTPPASPEVAVTVNARRENVGGPGHIEWTVSVCVLCVAARRTRRVRRYVFHAGDSYVV